MASPKDIATAGEYVLGTLPLSERRAFQQRLALEPDLQDEVNRWQAHLEPLAEEILPVDPPAHIWRGVEQRLFGAPTQRRAPLWRGFGLGAALATAAVFAVLWLGPFTTPPEERLWVSDMVSADGTVRLAALYDETSGEMRVSVGGEAPAEGRDWELWLIKDARAPISLGVMPRAGTAAMPIPEELRALVADATLAITDEPTGGAPQGIATGPVVAEAPLRRI